VLPTVTTGCGCVPDELACEKFVCEVGTGRSVVGCDLKPAAWRSLVVLACRYPEGFYFSSEVEERPHTHSAYPLESLAQEAYQAEDDPGRSYSRGLLGPVAVDCGAG